MRATHPWLAPSDGQPADSPTIRFRAMAAASGSRGGGYAAQEPGGGGSYRRVSCDGTQHQHQQQQQHQQPPPGSKAVSAYSGGHGLQADFGQSAINLATCVLGAGALGYPFCFKSCGLLLATIIMFATLIATRISYQLLLYCAQLSGRKTYEGVAEAALGRPGRQVVELCIAAMNLGALVAFLDILADVLSSVAGTIIPPGAEPSRHAYITGVTLLGALPVSLVVREPAVIANMSNAAVVFVVVFAVVVFCTAFGPSAAAALGVRWAARTGGALSAAAAKAAHAPVLHMWNPQGVLVSLPVMAYGFTAHQYYMGIYGMLKAPTIRKMKAVTDTALLACAGVYWTVGVGGYATFGDRTAGDIIRNFGGARSEGMWGAYERALKLCYGMAVLGNVPLVLMPFSSILAPLLPGDEQLKQQTSSLAAACSVAAAKRATSAALGGCGGAAVQGGSSAADSSSTGYLLVRHVAAAPKARTSGSGGGSAGRAGFSEGGGGGYRGYGSAAAQAGTAGMDAEALVLEPPRWLPNEGPLVKDSGGAGLSSSSSRAGKSHPQLEQEPLLAPAQVPPPRTHSPEDDPPQHPHLTREATRVANALTGPQHTLVVVLVLGVGLASAVWLPNVELIFGLTGSTASVLAAFIMPAICFLRLYEMAPELGSGGRRHHYAPLGGGSGGACWRALQYLLSCCNWLPGRGGSSYASFGGRPGAGARQHRSSDPSWQAPASSSGGSGGHKVWGPVLVVPELRAQWACRQRLALLLLLFGLISGLLCTDAILSSISEEKAVVQLAQELVAHEAVVAETSRAQQKAKEAAAAVDAVSTAAQQLGAVDSSTNQTLGTLAAAAAALNTITPKNGSAGAKGGHAGAERQQQPAVWDLKGRIEQHKQKAVEDSVLRNVEAALSAAAADLAATTTSVTAVIIKLDTSIGQIKADAAAAATAAAATPTVPAVRTTRPAAGGSKATHAPDGTVVLQPSSGSGAIVPHIGEQPAAAADAAAAAGSATSAGGAGGDGSKPAAAASDSSSHDAPASSSSSGGGGGNVAFARANEMARELGKALGTFGHGANLTLTAGRSLEQVRDSAVAALTALNVTADVVRQVRGAVAAARHSHHDSQAKEMALAAMQRALNATAASALAMRITRDALSTAANEETSELLTALTRVANDLERSAGVASGSSSSSSGGGGSGGKRPSITVTSEGGGGSAGGASEPAAAAGVGAAGGSGHAPGGGSAKVGASSQAAADSGARPAGSGQAGAAAAGDAGSSGGAGAGSGDKAATPTHPTLEEHQATAAAAANAAAHESTATVEQDGAAHAAGDATGPADGSEPAGQHGAADAAAAAANAAAHGAEGDAAAAAQLLPTDGTQRQQPAGTGDATTAVPAVARGSSGSGAADEAPAAAAAGDGAQAAAASKQHAPSEAPKQQQQQQQHADAAAAPADGHAQGSGSSIDAGEQAGSGSGSSSVGGGGGAKAAADAAAATSAVDKALSAAEATKVRSVIAHLASVLSTSGAAGAPGAAHAAAAPGAGSGAANVTQLAGAIQDAIAWTQQSKAAALDIVARDLGKTDPKVAERVLGIVAEVSTTGTAARREQDAAEEAAAAVGAAAVKTAAAEAAAAGSASGGRRGDPGHHHHHHKQQQRPHDAVAGPVVAADEHVQPQAAAAAERPVVALPGPAGGEEATGADGGDHAAAAASTDAKPDDAEREAVRPELGVAEAVVRPAAAPADSMGAQAQAAAADVVTRAAAMLRRLFQ